MPHHTTCQAITLYDHYRFKDVESHMIVNLLTVLKVSSMGVYINVCELCKRLMAEWRKTIKYVFKGYIVNNVNKFDIFNHSGISKN